MFDGGGGRKRVSRQAKELNDNDIIDEWAGGEGAVDCNFVGNDGIDDIILEVILFILLKFHHFGGDFGAVNDFVGVALVESIDKRFIFGLVSMSNR